MPATRLPLASLVVLVTLVTAGSAAAQQVPAANILLQPEAWQKVLPSDPGGNPIADGNRALAYGVAVVGFLIVFALTRVVVRVLAYLAYILLVVGGVALLCSLISDGLLPTWQMLALTTAALGGYLGATSMVVGLFTMNQNDEKKSGGGGGDTNLTAQLDLQRAELRRLSRELADLKEKAGDSNG